MSDHAPIRRNMRADAAFRCAAATLLLVSSCLLHAGEIYKSVDANGNVVYSDHLDPSLSQTAVHLEDSRSLPHEMHVCWTNCFTLILDDDVYRRVDGTDESWTVEVFSSEAVVLHRHDAPADWNGNSQDVIYAGRVSNERLIDMTVNGNPVSGVDAAWGGALATLPGSNAERDATGGATDPPRGDVTTASTPPPVPVEEQPALTEDGQLWTPGYWLWQAPRFFWVGGAWVRPPQFGLLWTPAYWSPAGTVYVFHPGRWGSTVGFYGGANYGHGYFGHGYTGGHWIGDAFAYNSAVNRVTAAVAHHTYAESPSRPATPGLRGDAVAAARSAGTVGNAGASQSSPTSTARAVIRSATPRPVAPLPAPSSATKPDVSDSRTPAASAPAANSAPRPSRVSTNRVTPVKQ